MNKTNEKKYLFGSLAHSEGMMRCILGFALFFVAFWACGLNAEATSFELPNAMLTNTDITATQVNNLINGQLNPELTIQDDVTLRLDQDLNVDKITIQSGKSLTIEGSGTLTVTSHVDAITNNGSFIVNSGNISLTADGYGVNGNTSSTIIIRGGSITSNRSVPGYRSMIASKNITVSGGTVSADSLSARSNGSITISGGLIDLDGNADDGASIVADSTIDISGGRIMINNSNTNQNSSLGILASHINISGDDTYISINVTNAEGAAAACGMSSLIISGQDMSGMYIAQNNSNNYYYLYNQDGSIVRNVILRSSQPVHTKSHKHSYEWQEVRAATEDADGEMIYVCTICGDVLYREATSAYNVFNINLMNKILKAAPGATVTVDTDKWISFHHMIIDTLAKRPDVTLKINFLSEGHKGIPMSVTIPAGADYPKLIDENGFTGFLFLGSKYGVMLRQTASSAA